MHHVLSLAALALLLAGCGAKTNVSISTRVGSPTAASALTQALAVSGGITLTHVRIVVQRIKLERPSTLDGGAGVAEQELVVGPFLIDLQGAQLEGGINKLFTVNAEAGEYRKIKFRIHKLEDAEAGSDLKLAEMRGLSIRVEGQRNGVDFTFDSTLDEDQEREGNFTLHAGDNNIALNINPTGWFMNGTTALDPSDPSARSMIEANIKASIDSFKDDDRTGHR